MGDRVISIPTGGVVVNVGATREATAVQHRRPTRRAPWVVLGKVEGAAWDLDRLDGARFSGKCVRWVLNAARGGKRIRGEVVERVDACFASDAAALAEPHAGGRFATGFVDAPACSRGVGRGRPHVARARKIHGTVGRGVADHHGKESGKALHVEHRSHRLSLGFRARSRKGISIYLFY